MAKLFPDWQEYVELKGVSGVGRQEKLGIHRVTIVTTGSDDLVVPVAEDVAVLSTDKETADPAFYFSGNNNTVVNIDGGTVGAEHLVVTRHSGMLNFKDEV